MKALSAVLLLAAVHAQTQTQAQKEKIHRFELSELETARKENFSYDPRQNQYAYEISIPDTKVIAGKKLFLILESESPDFVVTIIDDSKGAGKASALMDLATFSGNLMMVMSDTFFNKKLDFFKKTGSLKFIVTNKAKLAGSLDYKLRVEVAETVDLDMGRSYTTRTDIKIKELSFNLNYNGLAYPDLQKLRFQLTSVRQQKNYSLSASLQHLSNFYQLNTIFQKTVGGILALPNLPVCTNEQCSYNLNIKLSKVKVLNIESFLISKIEKITIQHFEEYYDRVYAPSVTFYELVYEDSMENMDVTINLIPVTGTTGLYVNARTLPLDLENFDWKEKGPLAKRVTIKWDELVQMRAEKSNLFIAISTSKPGEFLIKVDAHDPGYKGRLNSGIIEAGFVNFNEFNNYLYFFEVYETQEITFDLRLNIVSGDANLYLKQCANYANCKIDPMEIVKSEVYKVENTQNSKLITHTFTCEHKGPTPASTCEFVIGVSGKENHGTHFEISLQETNFHRLMIPGHSVPLNLSTDQTIYLKFSYPSKNKDSSLYLSIEALWGTFDVILSKKDVYPADSGTNMKESFVSTKLGLYNSLRTTKIDPSKLDDYGLQGLYYIAVKATTSCSLNIKFFEKSQDEVTVHTLIAGSQVRGEITHSNETIYYTIKAALETQQASSVSVTLTPLKGQYRMMANRNGKLPMKENHELESLNHHLELTYQSYDNKQDEYIIGVQLNDSDGLDLKDSTYQFLISLVYSNKALTLNPGILSSHVITEGNFFVIEVSNDMRTLLIMKSIVDGYNLSMCAKFASVDTSLTTAECAYTADEKVVAVYIAEDQLRSKCKDATKGDANARCFIQVSVQGNKSQKFSIGFAYNDHPFQLVKGLAITGPSTINSAAKVNFIYHAEPSKPIVIYFNSKGRDLQIYTKLVRGDHFDDQQTLNFPTLDNHDTTNQQKHGYITNIYYEASTVETFGSSPEVLIAIRSNGTDLTMFDPRNSFILQASVDAQEILRTQTFNTDVKEDAWNYFTLYNNGISDTLRIYVATTITTKLEVSLSKGIQSRPPFSNKPLISKVGIGSVDLDIVPSDLKLESHNEKPTLKGHFTVAVKSSNACNINIFWNNKEDLNYIELTPNEPSSMFLDHTKNFYFTFYAKDADTQVESDRGIISLYAKTNVKANIFLLKTSGELSAPSSSTYTWKGSLGQMGGITIIQIKPTDPEYCVDCLYIGYVQTLDDGQISLLVNLKHDKIPISLTPGFTFPDALLPNEKLFYRIYNPDLDTINLSISMLSGFINVYISANQDVTENKFDEFYPLESKLDIHKFISIAPSKYNVSGAHNYYLLIVNLKLDTATFTLTVDKNGIKSPVEPGITKFLHLGPGESTDFIYAPKEKENLFEVRLELRQVLDPALMDKALESLANYLSVYLINEKNDRYLLKNQKKSFSGNKIYVSFDITENTKGTFAIHLYNPINSAVALSVDLLNGGYKLVNLNEFNVDMIRKEDQIIYEAFGQKAKYLFVDIKVCHGNVNLDFFQDDYENIASNNSTEYKQLKDSNSMVHYLKLEHERVFLKVTNKNEDLSIYEISLFNERDLDNNPYSEISQGNGGKVEIETDNNLIRFHPISLRSTYSKEFYHSVNYTVYLTDNLKVMRYSKNCGSFMINHAFDNPHILAFSEVIRFNSTEDVDKIKDQMTIKIANLRMSTKYYGVLVAKIDLFPTDSGYISPVRSGKTFYDEFVFITPKFNIPFNLIVSIIVCVAFFLFLVCCIKAYIFGRVNQMKMFERLTDLSKYDEGVLGMNVISILEKEYYGDINNPPAQEEETAGENAEGPTPDIESGSGSEFEMTEQNNRSAPLNG